jgi:heat shock protein HslJ/uncharacterized membrane protein
MMMNKVLTLLLCTPLFFACASLRSIDTNKTSGLYQADLPCEGCRGIKTNILINPDFSFERTSIYLGKEDGFVEAKGNWKVENDSTISLNENGRQQHYRIRDNALLSLNQEGDIAGNTFLKVDQTIKTEGDFTQQKAKGIDFFASGNEPFWFLEIISEKTLTFNLIDAKPIVLKDIVTTYKNGITMIKSKSKNPAIEATIYNYQCVNDMSGAISSNYVEVNVSGQLYKGCGRPLNKDFEISGKWNLSFIKDYNIPTDQTGKNPFINFNIQEKKVNGNFGCNGFGGNYSLDTDSLRITNVMGTLMACTKMDTENRFSAALQQTDSYKIVNNELQLYKGKELLLGFKR